MAYCTQCGANCANTPYCAQCEAKVVTGASDVSNERCSNPYDVGARIIDHSNPIFNSNTPEIPDFFGAITTCCKKCFSFKGRASRSEFWFWFLFVLIVNFGLHCVALYGFPKIRAAFFFAIYCVWFLIIFLPTLAVYVRRLHDLDISGLILLKTVFIAFSLGVAVVVRGKKIPEGLTLAFFTFCVVNIWIMASKCCRRGTDGENRFGLEPQKRRKDRSKDDVSNFSA